MYKAEVAKIINSPEKSAFIKNYDNIVQLQKDGLLSDTEGVKYSKNNVQNLRTLIGQIIEVFGEQWDIHAKIDSRGLVAIHGIDIMFPNIVIKNSKKESHKISDFLLRIRIFVSSSEHIRIGRIEGARASVTLKEYSCGYVHSHVPRTSYGSAPEGPGFSKFCTGSGEINNYFNDYASNNSEAYAERIVMQLYTMVNWESLEGAPHFKMEGIRYNSSSNNSVRVVQLGTIEHIQKGFSDTVLQLIETGKLPVDGLKANIVDNKISIEVGEQFMTNLMSNSTLQEYIGVDYNGMVVTEQSLIDYVKTQNSKNPHGVKVPTLVEKTGYFFNGKEVGLTISDFKPVEKEENKVELEINYKIPEQYVNKFKNSAEREIYEQQIRGSIAERYA